MENSGRDVLQERAVKAQNVGGSISLVCAEDCIRSMYRLRRDRPSVEEHRGGQ